MKNIIFLTALIILAATLIILPSNAYALSIYVVPPSKLVIHFLDLLLDLIVVLFIISLIISAFTVKTGKTTSKFAKLTVILVVVGIFLLIFRSVLIFAPWELIDKNYLMNFKSPSQQLPHPEDLKL